MANIYQYVKQIRDAIYGEEVRSSIINALNKVNDDNNSYADIKKEIIAAKDNIDEKVAAFDAKVTAAEQATANLVTATSTANAVKSQLTSATSTANTAKTNLQNTITAANTKKSEVEVVTTAANTAKTNLESTITSANTAKSNLQTVIDSANSIKSTLDTTNKTASTAKTNLETAITNANTTKTQLQDVIDNVGEIKTELSTVISQANTAKQNLDASVATASGVYQFLQAENTSATSNLNELRSENFNSQEILAGVADLRAYLGYTDEDIVGLQVDYENKTFTRIAGAKNLTAGADFDKFSMYGGRKRCNVADDGTIVAWYGDADYAEDGSMGQVMVYQPKFYYLVAPIEWDAQETGIGYHLRKANYYVSEKPRAGFRLHPAFYDKNGNEVDYVLMSAFEGCIYDTSANAYLLNDEQVMDVSNDKFSSIAGARPASGASQNLTRANIEQIAQNRGEGWHSLGIKTASMEQLLMTIEMGMMNFQTAIGQGITYLPWQTETDKTSSYAGVTGSTGNRTGIATKTTTYEGGVATEYTVNGKTSICYRGVENFWGNIYKCVYGVNIYGNGKMAGGMPYICSDFNYAESKNTDNYEGAGFTVTNMAGYISAMGYSTKYDWLFIASECFGNNSLPVSDYTYITENLNGYRIARLGGYWGNAFSAGGFCWDFNSVVGFHYRNVGGRLVYVPTATV